LTDIYTVVCNRPAELEAIRVARPKRVLLSYHYFKNMPLSEFLDSVGYEPVIMLDSGAYSAFTSGKNISPVDYMQYIRDNRNYIDEYVALDVIGSSSLSFAYWRLMMDEGYRNAIPVFHYGEPFHMLSRYVAGRRSRAALGGCVPVEDKSAVADWVIECMRQYPNVEFHLLGCNHKIIRERCSGLASRDFSTWIMAAANGYPKSIPGRTRDARIARAVENLSSLEKTGAINWGA
jgi:hypothetical protein